MVTPGLDDARYALGLLNDLPVIAWETQFHGWLLPATATLLVTNMAPGPLPDDATDAAIALHLAAGGVALVIGDPYDAFDHVPAPTWTIEITGPTITVRTPDRETAFTATDHTVEAHIWTGEAQRVGHVGLFTGRDLLDPAGNIDVHRAARAGTLIAGSATLTAPTPPR
jgi:hypothetical protein